MDGLLLEENEERMQQLFALRRRIAGLWCIYAHVVMELGDLCLRQQQQQRQHNDRKQQQRNHSPRERQQESQKQYDAPPDGRRGDPRNGEERKITFKTKTASNTAAVHSSTATVAQIIEHVMAVLRAARSCPLVGNHSWIVLALGRFIMSGLALKHLPPPPSVQQVGFEAGEGEADGTTVATMDHDTVQDTILLVIETCWDAMDDSCHGTCNYFNRRHCRRMTRKIPLSENPRRWRIVLMDSTPLALGW
jgi:hypothetical protein